MGLARSLSLSVLVCSVPQLALAQALPALISRVAASVVVVSDENGNRGSGFAVAGNGVIVTSLHVIARMRQPRVTLADGRSFDEVSIAGYDSDRDLAVLKVPATGLRALALGASSKVKVGQRVVAFGAPWGLSGTVTNGIVSAIRRHPRLPGATLLQTDAAINPGNSGGPLVDASGKVVGVVVSMMNNAQNLGFAAPADDLRPLLRARNPAFSPEELRGRLLLTEWGPSILPRRWRADGDFYLGTAPGALYELEGKDNTIRLTILRPDAEAWLGRKLVLSLTRGEQRFEGGSGGEVQCETLRESRRMTWQQKNAQITRLSFDRIEMSFLAPGPPDPQGDCRLEFQAHRVALIPAGESEAAPATGEAERLESIRAQRAAYTQRRERMRRDCPDVRAKLERECTRRTEWNAASCGNFRDLADVCGREGF